MSRSLIILAIGFVGGFFLHEVGSMIFSDREFIVLVAMTSLFTLLLIGLYIREKCQPVDDESQAETTPTS